MVEFRIVQPRLLRQVERKDKEGVGGGKVARHEGWVVEGDLLKEGGLDFDRRDVIPGRSWFFCLCILQRLHFVGACFV